MNDFQVWFYTGLIAALFGLVIWLLRTLQQKQEDWIKKQEAINVKLFTQLEKFTSAVTRLNTILESGDKVCLERHRGVDRRIDYLEKAM